MTTKLEIRHVRLDRQGYTKRGEYYGVGEKLYCTSDFSLSNRDACVRAPSAKAARPALVKLAKDYGKGSFSGAQKRRRRSR